MNARPLVLFAILTLTLLASCGVDQNSKEGESATSDAGDDVSYVDAGNDAADASSSDTDVEDTSDASNADAGNETGPPLVCRDEFDDGDDGTVDNITHYEYDADGNVVLKTKDSDADGQSDSSITNSYDSEGRLVRSEEDSDGDGSIDRRTNRTIETQADGGYKSTGETDDGLDGSIDAVSVWYYDAEDNVVRFENDEDADGTADFIGVSEYDADGRNVSGTYDTDGDGVADMRWTNIYSAEGYLERRDYDYGDDGTVDMVERFIYEDGLRVRSEMGYSDGNNEFVVEYFYDC